MRFLARVLGFIVGTVVAISAAHAATISVDLSSQTMHVESSSGAYDWPISSGRSGFGTPRGSYGVQRLEAMHRSHKYHNSPMPHSIFFHGGFAIHGTYEVGSLGAPASHGCIRISPAHAALLYSIVREEGARISITGSPSGGTRYARAGRHHRGTYYAYHRVPTPDALGYAQPEDDTPSIVDWMRAPAGGYDLGGY